MEEDESRLAKNEEGKTMKPKTTPAIIGIIGLALALLTPWITLCSVLTEQHRKAFFIGGEVIGIIFIIIACHLEFGDI